MVTLKYPALWEGCRFEGCFRKDGQPHDDGAYHNDGPFVLKEDYDRLVKFFTNPISEGEVDASK